MQDIYKSTNNYSDFCHENTAYFYNSVIDTADILSTRLASKIDNSLLKVEHLRICQSLTIWNNSFNSLFQADQTEMTDAMMG